MFVKVVNLAKCLKKFDNISNIDVMPIIREGTRKVQRTAKDIVPVSATLRRKSGEVYHIGGTLRDSIKVKFNNKDKWGIVFTATEYAPYVEFGTYKMKAQPYLKPAVDINRVGIQQRLMGYIRQQLKTQTT